MAGRKKRIDDPRSKAGKRRMSKNSKKAIKEALDGCISPEDVAMAIAEGITTSRGNLKLNYIKIYLDYREGKPKQQVDHTSGGKSIETSLKDVVKFMKAPSPKEIEEANTINIDHHEDNSEEED